MALHLGKSRTLVRSLKSKLGLLGSINRTTDALNSSPIQNRINPFSISVNNFNFSSSRCSKSTLAEQIFDSVDNNVDASKFLNFPGGEVKVTTDLKFIPGTSDERVHCYRVLDDSGQPLVPSNVPKIDKETAVKMYKNMVTLQVMDTIFYEAQRQGRISFYVTQIGEEAINIASAAALNFEDLVFPQYREPGVLLWRGFTLQEFANQLLSNEHDYGKGKQMPVHYGSKKLNYFQVSSTVGTQIPHAVGAAYSLKVEGADACTVTYFGDGGSSTSDFHAALNFAAVLETPVIFFCRNNGFAISTPISEQLRSDGIVVRGQAYGITSIRIDGNDALAVYNAVQEARKIAITQKRPVLIEAMTYRAGHHSTSDDSTKYREAEEIEYWRKSKDPVARFGNWVQSKGWWDTEAESDLRTTVRRQLMHVIQVAENSGLLPLSDMIQDVYEVAPANLIKQEASVLDSLSRHPSEYPSGFPL
jgi:2-oxoisovalerate dehydrogenase E1 component alpha subunit